MIEVLKQALEALNLCTNAGMFPMYLQTNQVAITSLRQAIAELVSQEPVAWMDADGNVSDNNDHKCFPIPLYTHQPQRMEQEPVIMWSCHIIEADFHERTITLGMECGDYKVSAGTHWLSTHPPQRKPLTDEECADLWDMQVIHITDRVSAKQFIRDIEAAHSIKE